MKKMPRLLVTILALALCAALLATALAEGKLLTLYQAGTGLLFDTDNVTLTLHAEFSYDGLPFKTMDSQYVQAGTNSLMDIKLKTPRADGSVRDSGFTVVANDNVAYSIEPALNPYVYSATGYQPNDSVMSDTLLRRALTRLGGTVVSAAEGVFADKIEVSGQADGSRDYHIRVRAGETPELINQAGTLAAQLMAAKYFYMDYDWKPAEEIGEDDDSGESSVMISYDDYDATFALYYQKLFGEKLPEDFYDTLWGGEGSVDEAAYEKYVQVSDAMYEGVVETARQNYDSGVVLIHADGSTVYYESYDEYVVATNTQMVEFQDIVESFRHFYQEKTGTELSQEELVAVYSSNNNDLWEAYQAMYDEMEQKYQRLVEEDGKASLILVSPDGSYRMIYDYNKYAEAQYMLYGTTVTRQILGTMDQLALGDTDVTVTLDAENRVRAAQGTVTVLVTDIYGESHDVTVTFEAAADQYGESAVAEFDPADYGVMTWEEYNKSGLADAPAQKETVLPETVIFDGIPYQVTVED